MTKCQGFENNGSKNDANSDLFRYWETGDPADIDCALGQSDQSESELVPTLASREKHILRKVVATLGAGAVALSLWATFRWQNESVSNYQDKLEACVSEIAGHPVDLKTAGDEGLALATPAGAERAVNACESSQGDVETAKIYYNFDYRGQ